MPIIIFSKKVISPFFFKSFVKSSTNVSLQQSKCWIIQWSLNEVHQYMPYSNVKGMYVKCNDFRRIVAQLTEWVIKAASCLQNVTYINISVHVIVSCVAGPYSQSKILILILLKCHSLSFRVFNVKSSEKFKKNLTVIYLLDMYFML